MNTQNQTTQTPKVYAYTQHASTIRVIEETCGIRITVLPQDRTKDPVEDVLSKIKADGEVVLYAVLPLDKAIELRQKAPWIMLRLLQLDGKIVEKLTGRPYDPKTEYDPAVIRQALRVFEIRGGSIRYLRCIDDLLCELNGKKVAVFNDTLREALRIVNKNRASVELVKTCDSGDCVEINPLGYRSGYRISFPGTAGRLTPEQMVEMLTRGEARIYYVDVQAQEVPLCS